MLPSIISQSLNTHREPDRCPRLWEESVIVLSDGKESQIVPCLADGQTLNVGPGDTWEESTRVVLDVLLGIGYDGRLESDVRGIWQGLQK